MHIHPVQPGCTALVTGGASGIGLGIAQALLEAGMQVVVTDVRPDHMAKARASLEAMSDQVTFLTLDVTDRTDWIQARRAVEQQHGSLHLLCLNAGVGVLGSMLDSSEQDWEWITSVNLLGVLFGVETFLPNLLGHGGPSHVVATSSMGGLTVANDGGIYSTTKFGVVALIEQLRRELGTGTVGASVLCPAAVNTNIFDHERMRPPIFSPPGESRDERELADAEAFAKQILAMGRTPIEVGRMVRDGVRRNQAYIFTDRNVESTILRRRDALLSFA